MPFDGLHRYIRDDLAVLKIARDGVRSGWIQYHFGKQDWDRHCIIGWLHRFAQSEADGDRIAIKYVYPALPLVTRLVNNNLLLHPSIGRLGIVIRYNDAPWRTQRQMDRLMDRVIARAERIGSDA